MSTLIRAEASANANAPMTDVRPYKRRERHEEDGAVYSLTFSCFGRRPLFTNDVIKDRFVERLAATRDVSFLAWAIMPRTRPHCASSGPGRTFA